MRLSLQRRIAAGIRRDSEEADAEQHYQRWRARIPFSNEAFAAVYDTFVSENENSFMADLFRKRAAKLRAGGRVSKRDLRNCLGDLITKCGICGKPALYRYGSQGRCRTHRSDAPLFAYQRRIALEAKHTAITNNVRDRDRLERLRDHGRRRAAAERATNRTKDRRR